MKIVKLLLVVLVVVNLYSYSQVYAEDTVTQQGTENEQVEVNELQEKINSELEVYRTELNNASQQKILLDQRILRLQGAVRALEDFEEK